MALLLVAALTMLVPLLWMVSTSLMDELEVYREPLRLLPERPRWENYPAALGMLPFGRFFVNTGIMALGIIAGQLVVCSLAAYSFARLRFRGRDSTFVLFLSTLMVPQIVTLIPAYLIVHGLGWLNTYWALIVPFINSVWGIFLLRQFFLTLPRELDESARLDGASEWTILFRIVLPLARPALVTLAVFAFLSTWQSFLWPLIVTDRMEMRPVEVGIAMFQSLYTRNWPYQMAAAVTVMVPMIVVFAIAQRHFTRGISLTGMKG
jgi:multiple sugar transport system permease protein